MSDLTRLTSDVARRVGAERIALLAPAEPTRAAELAERHEVVELELPSSGEAPDGDLAKTLVVCDGALESAVEP